MWFPLPTWCQARLRSSCCASSLDARIMGRQGGLVGTDHAGLFAWCMAAGDRHPMTFLLSSGVFFSRMTYPQPKVLTPRWVAESLQVQCMGPTCTAGRLTSPGRTVQGTPEAPSQALSQHWRQPDSAKTKDLIIVLIDLAQATPSES